MGKLKYTTEEVVEQFRTVHGNRYDYSKTVYGGNRAKVIIGCKVHGEFRQSYVGHKRGSGCPKCKSVKLSNHFKDTKEGFVEKSRKVHGDFFNYDLVDYKNGKTKVVIICPLHGKFHKAPDKHKAGQGCQQCWAERRGKSQRLTAESFINQSKNIHGDRYNYDLVEYVGIDTPVDIVCELHGKFSQTPYNHRRGSGCPECANISVGNKRRKPKSVYIQQAEEVHGDKYNYDLVKYKSLNRKVDIVCRKHGVFSQHAGSHLKGAGCPLCNKSIGWTRSNWVEHCRGKVAKLYVVRCYNKQESFTKFGITSNSVKIRFSGGKLPYKYKTLKLIKSKDAAYIYDLERRIKRFFKKRRYRPLIHFQGHTDCLTYLNVKSTKNFP